MKTAPGELRQIDLQLHIRAGTSVNEDKSLILVGGGVGQHTIAMHACLSQLLWA